MLFRTLRHTSGIMRRFMGLYRIDSGPWIAQCDTRIINKYIFQHFIFINIKINKKQFSVFIPIMAPSDFGLQMCKYTYMVKILTN